MSHFSTERSEYKSKLIKTANKNKGNITTNQSELEVNIQMCEARENTEDQVSVVFDWWVRWYVFLKQTQLALEQGN